MTTPSRGAKPGPRRRAYVPQDLSRRRGAREVGGGWDRPRVRGFTKNDTPVAVTGALARPRLMQAKGSAPVSTPGLAHRAGLGGGPPARGTQFIPTGRREAPATIGRQRPTTGAPRLAHRAGQRRFPRTREAGTGLPQVGRVTVTAAGGDWLTPPKDRARVSRPRMRGLANDRAPISVPRTFAGLFLVYHLRRSRVVPVRSFSGPGARGLTAAILTVLTRPSAGLFSQVGNNPLPVTPRREKAGRTRGRGWHPKGNRRGPRGEGREESLHSPAELWRTEEEADVVRVVDDRGVIRVALGPEGVRRADVGLVPRSHVVDDTPRPFRYVFPMAPRAATDTGAVDKGPPPHVFVVVPHPGGIARAHTSHRVEGLIRRGFPARGVCKGQGQNHRVIVLFLSLSLSLSLSTHIYIHTLYVYISLSLSMYMYKERY